MTTKSQRIIKTMEDEGAKFLGYSSVWDIHNSNIGENRNSNVYKDALPHINAGKKVCAIIGLEGCKGHSKTDVLLFDLTGLKEEDFTHYADVHMIGSL